MAHTKLPQYLSYNFEITDKRASKCIFCVRWDIQVC